MTTTTLQTIARTLFPSLYPPFASAPRTILLPYTIVNSICYFNRDPLHLPLDTTRRSIVCTLVVSTLQATKPPSQPSSFPSPPTLRREKNSPFNQSPCKPTTMRLLTLILSLTTTSLALTTGSFLGLDLLEQDGSIRHIDDAS